MNKLKKSIARVISNKKMKTTNNDEKKDSHKATGLDKKDKFKSQNWCLVEEVDRHNKSKEDHKVPEVDNFEHLARL